MPRSDDDERGVDGVAPAEAIRPPSRSAMKRQARALTELAARLVTCSPSELGALGLSEPTLRAIEQARNTSAHIARKRHIAYVGKLLRGEDAAAVEAAFDEAAVGRSDRDNLLMALEGWRTRLIEEGDAALDAFLEAYAGGDRRLLRQHARAARRAEPSTSKAKRASRLLFAALRDAAADTATPGEES